jgi:hypothetical protein
LLFTPVAQAQTTNGLSEAEIKGRDLAQQLCEARLTETTTNVGVLRIHHRDGPPGDICLQFRFKAAITPAGWRGIYETTSETCRVSCAVDHENAGVNYFQIHNDQPETIDPLVSFAGSDFSLADLGLEFFHWPAQKVLPNTTRLKRGRAYTLLESTNPNPPTNGYSRVKTWIDKESGGILEAEAYDANGKLLKVFEPKSFKKINGQWELQEMEIRNVQTGSRTRLEFDLKK